MNGDWQGAANEWKKLGCPYEEALALADGNEDSKRKALTILESLGATATINLIKQQMRQEGIKKPPGVPKNDYTSVLPYLDLPISEVNKHKVAKG